MASFRINSHFPVGFGFGLAEEKPNFFTPWGEDVVNRAQV